MANEQTVPEQGSDKKQGDKLDSVVNGVLDKGTGLTQDTSDKGSEPTKQDEPLK